MNAIIFNEKGKADEVLEFRDTKTPKLHKNELMIKMLAAPVNPADFMFIEKQYRVQPEFPQIAGFEGTGIIAENGGDENYPAGSLVAFRYKNAWAEYAAVPKEKIILLPDDFPVEKAAQLSLNPLTAWALLEEVNANENEWLLLSAGNSALSKLIIQFAKKRNIKTLSIVRDETQNEELLRIGASAVLVPDGENIQQQIQIIINDGRIAGFLDAVGGELASKIIKIISPQSTVIHYGLFSEQNICYHSSDVIFRNLTIKGFGIDAWIKSKPVIEIKEAWHEIIHESMDNNFRMDVSGKYFLKDYKKAIHESKTLKNGKILFWINQEL